MDTGHALGEPHRRGAVEMLAHGSRLGASQISGQLDVAPPANSQRPKLLRKSYVVRREKRAQQQPYALDPRSLDEIEGADAQMSKFRTGRRDRAGKAQNEEAR